MDSITSNIVDYPEQETTSLTAEVSAREGLGVSDLAVCHLCHRGYFISRGCDHHALNEKQPLKPFYSLTLKEWRKCEWCRVVLDTKDKTVCKTCRDVLKSKRKVA